MLDLSDSICVCVEAVVQRLVLFVKFRTGLIGEAVDQNQGVLMLVLPKKTPKKSFELGCSCTDKVLSGRTVRIPASGVCSGPRFS